MDSTVLETLQTGDLVRHRATGEAFIIQREGKRLIGIRTVDVSNPQEWDLPFWATVGKESS